MQDIFADERACGVTGLGVDTLQNELQDMK